MRLFSFRSSAAESSAGAKKRLYHRWLIGCIAALMLGLALIIIAPAAEVEPLSKDQVRSLATKLQARAQAEGFSDQQIETVIYRLHHLDMSRAGDADFLLNTQDYVAGKVRSSMYQAYLKTAIAPRWQRYLKYLQSEVKSGNHIAEVWLAWANIVGKNLIPPSRFEWSGLPETHRTAWEAAHKLNASRQFQGDPKQGSKLLSAAMDAGQPRAQTMFAQLLAVGGMYNLRAGKDTKNALEVAGFAVEDGDLAAMQLAAWLYGFGPRALQDHKKAVELATRAADRGYIQSKVLLGWMYISGIGIKADPEKARQIAITCARLGRPYAKRLLAYCLQNGIGGPKKLQEAFTIAQQLAKQGDRVGMATLGNDYFNGWGVAQDKATGVEWWKRAGQAGEPAGYQAVGRAYLKGDGVPKNLSRAWLAFTLAQSQLADQSAIEAWAEKYRHAKLLNTRQWLRNLKAVRVTAKSLSDERSDEKMQYLAEVAVLNYGLKLDPKADVELKFHMGLFANDGSQHNMAYAYAEFRTCVPVLMRGEFINSNVVIQYGMSYRGISKDLDWVYLDNELSKVAKGSIEGAMEAEVESENAPMDPPQLKKELWPPDQDRRMYVKYQVARSFGREIRSFPLSGFTAVSDPQIRIINAPGVSKWKLESEWENGLEQYGIGFDQDASYYINFDVWKPKIHGFFNPARNLILYSAFDKRNVMIPLANGRLARTSVGLVSLHYASTLTEDSDVQDIVITRIQKICEQFGPLIQKGVKAPLIPVFYTSAPTPQK